MQSRVFGLAAWQGSSCQASSSSGTTSAYLHGLYVDPEVHGLGTGSRLLDWVEMRAHGDGYRELWTKSQKEAEPFYYHSGFALSPNEADATPPRRLVKSLTSAEPDEPSRKWRRSRQAIR